MVNVVGDDFVQCSQAFGPRGAGNLLINLTVCNGSGGHIYWGAEQANRDYKPGKSFGVSNMAFNVADEVVKFVC